MQNNYVTEAQTDRQTDGQNYISIYSLPISTSRKQKQTQKRSPQTVQIVFWGSPMATNLVLLHALVVVYGVLVVIRFSIP